MALSTKVNTTVDLRVSDATQRVVALNSATKLACTSMEQGYTMEHSELFEMADKCLEWLKRSGSEESDAE